MLSGNLAEAAADIYPRLEAKNRSPQIRLTVALIRYKQDKEFAELLAVPKRGLLPVFLPLVRKQLGLETAAAVAPEDFQIRLVEKALDAERQGDYDAAAELWLRAATRPESRNIIPRLQAYVIAAKLAGRTPQLGEIAGNYRPDSLEMNILARIAAVEPLESTEYRRLAVLLDELADYAMVHGDGYTAAVYARLSLLFDEDNQHAAVILGTALNGMGLRNWGEAEFYAAQLENGGVWEDVLRLSYARVLGDRGRRGEAEALLEDYLAASPNNLSALLELADIARSDGDFKAAVDLYSRVIANSGAPMWDAHHLRGISYEQLGDWQPAERDFFAALEIMPNNPHVINYLAYSWLERGENFEKALAMLKKAQSLAADDPHIADSYGWALHKNDKNIEAVPFLEKALNQMPTDPTVNEHLGDVLHQLGKLRQASFYWRRAEQFAEKADDKQRLAKKLGEL